MSDLSGVLAKGCQVLLYGPICFSWRGGIKTLLIETAISGKKVMVVRQECAITEKQVVIR